MKLTTALFLVAALAAPTLVRAQDGGSSKALEAAHVPPPFQDIKTPGVPRPPKLDVQPGPAAAPSIDSAWRKPAPVQRSAQWVHDRVHVDPAQGGAIHARGDTYKARFDENGATFVPFFGSRAPRNFPVTFGLERVTVGGEVLDFDRAARPALGSGALVYDRSALFETYELRLASMEQLFVFEALPGGGDLVLEISAETELAGREGAEGIEFAGELGSVGYSSAVALDAGGRSLAVATELRDGAIRITVPASFLAESTWPLTIDPVVASFPISELTFNDYNTDVAYDESTDSFLVCFEREYSAVDHDVWAERWTSSGALVPNSGEYIDFTTECWSHPKVASNRLMQQFLVVAQRATDCSQVSEIWGRTRNAASTSMGTPFLISEGSGNKVNPDVGGDPSLVAPTYYCVVWERVITSTDHDISARLVNTSGAPYGGTITVENNTDNQALPSISKTTGHGPFSSQEWTIVWQDEYATGDWDIWGAQVHWDGQITQPAYSIDLSGLNHGRAAVSSLLDGGPDPREYLVAYEQGTSLDHVLRGTALVGTDIIDVSILTDLDGAGTGLDKIWPAVDSDGSQFVVAYSEQYTVGSNTDYDMFISSFYLAGDALACSEGHQTLAAHLDPERDAQLCSSGGASASRGNLRYMAVWRDGAPLAGNMDIEGGLYDMPAHYGKFIGTNYCGPAVPNSFGAPGVIGATGSALAGGEPLHLTALDLPSNQFGYFLVGPLPGYFQPPISAGFICLSNPIGRFNAVDQIGFTGAGHSIGLFVDTQALPSPSSPFWVVGPGETWRFQCWYRDIGNTNNFTDALEITFF